MVERDGELEKWLCGRGEGGETAEGIICWYVTWVIRIDGVIVFTWTEFLGCEGNAGGGNGSCGEEGDVGQDTLKSCQRGEIWLECDEAPKRGESVACDIKTDSLDLSLFTYAWTAEPGGWTSSDSGWAGTATTDREVTVVVTDTKTGNELLDEETTIRVQARTWTFEPMTHTDYTYDSMKVQRRGAWGVYARGYADPGAVREGSGPWEGEYYAHRPPQLKGHMYLHPDFDKTGSPHGLANKTCEDEIVPSLANVLKVNTICGYERALKRVWEPRVEKHEQKHEDGANKCLQRGGAAKAVLAEMEKMTGADGGKVKRKFDKAFIDFLEDHLDPAMETTTSTPTSPVIWEWRDNDWWTEQALRPWSHRGRDGC